MTSLSMSRFDNVLNSLEQFISMKTLTRNIRRFLQLCVVAAAVYGGLRGFQEAIAIIRRRRPVRLTNKTLEPIVNILAQIGIVALRPILTAILTAAVVATAPISVPYIMLVCK